MNAAMRQTKHTASRASAQREANWRVTHQRLVDPNCRRRAAFQSRENHSSIAHEINVRSFIPDEIADISRRTPLYPGVLDSGALPHRDDRTFLDRCVADLVENRPKSLCFQVADRRLSRFLQLGRSECRRRRAQTQCDRCSRNHEAPVDARAKQSNFLPAFETHLSALSQIPC